MSVELILGDCLEYMRTMPDGCVDAVMTDPPYSSGGAMRSDRVNSTSLKYTMTGTGIIRPEFSGDNRDQRSFLIWCNIWLTELSRICKQGAPIMLFTDWRQLPTITDALQVGGWVWRGIVPWNKTEAARPDKGRFRAQCEYIVWGSNGAMERDAEAECLPGFFTYVVRQADKFHITGKPTSLMVDLLKITNPGDLVIDPFMGSGTTGVACIQMGRNFMGCENTKEYFAIAERRIHDAQQQMHLFTEVAP